MHCVTDYDKLITIEESATTVDAHGHVDITADTNWSEYVKTWASVKSRGGREFWKVDQVQADVDHVWLCPYSAKLSTAKPQMRIKYEIVIYEIISVIDIDMEHQEIEIQTRRSVQ